MMQAKISYTAEEQWAVEYASSYAGNIEFTEKFIARNGPRRFVIAELYRWFVKNKNLTAIEKLDEQTKAEIFESAKKIFPAAAKESMKDLCIFLYLMNYLFENYFS